MLPCMPTTYFEREIEKALSRNTDAMFSVLIGDSHRHALIKGERQGLEIALRLFHKEFKIDEDGDGI